jgi:catechol 2,3-dioxygenase-like lactoylglutathione lyase family enzyme
VSGRLTDLDHVQLAAPPGSEEDMRAFYAGLLGMAEEPKPPLLAARGGCWFRAGAVRLHVGIEPGFAPSAKAHPAFRVAGLDELAARLAAAGAPVRWDAGIPGERRFHSADPVGNRLEFLAARPEA